MRDSISQKEHIILIFAYELYECSWITELESELTFIDDLMSNLGILW